MSTTSIPPTSTTTPAARPVPLRIGLVLCAVLLVAAAVPSLDVGFDGTGWDVVVVVLAVLVPAAAVATVVLVPFAWRGRRRPALAVAWIQLASLLQSVPPLLLPAGVLPGAAYAAIGAGALLTLVAAALVLVGLGRR